MEPGIAPIQSGMSVLHILNRCPCEELTYVPERDVSSLRKCNGDTAVGR